MSNDKIEFDDLAFDDVGEAVNTAASRPIYLGPSARTDHELEELGEQIKEAKDSKREYIISAWRRQPIRGKVVKLDGDTQTVHVKGDGPAVKVPFMEILSIRNPE